MISPLLGTERELKLHDGFYFKVFICVFYDCLLLIKSKVRKLHVVFAIETGEAGSSLWIPLYSGS